jgi:hypothetical protein
MFNSGHQRIWPRCLFLCALGAIFVFRLAKPGKPWLGHDDIAEPSFTRS